MLRFFSTDKISTTVNNENNIKKDSLTYKEIIGYSLLGVGVLLIMRYVDIPLSNPIDVCTEL